MGLEASSINPGAETLPQESASESLPPNSMKQISKTAWQRSKARPHAGDSGPTLQKSLGSCQEHQFALQPSPGASSSTDSTSVKFLGSSRFPGLLPAGGQIISEHRLFIWVPVHSLTPAGRALLPAVPRILLLLHLPLLHFPLS